MTDSNEEKKPRDSTASELTCLLAALEHQSQKVYSERKILTVMQHDYLIQKGWAIEPCGGAAWSEGYEFSYSKGDEIFLDIDHAMECEEEFSS